MQESISSPHWVQTALGLLASFLAGGGVYKLVNTWLNRKKPAAEVQLTEATATEVTIRASSSAGEAIMRFMDRLDTAQQTIDRLRKERDDEKLRADKATDDARASELFVEQLHAAARLAGVRLSDYTPQQLRETVKKSETDRA